jgi:CheY-like chemotaxis protein
MPRISGLEAVRTLRQNGIRTPILALTAHAMKEDHNRCLEVGCDDYLSKPVDRRRFKQLLIHFLGERSLIPSTAVDHLV